MKQETQMDLGAFALTADSRYTSRIARLVKKHLVPAANDVSIAPLLKALGYELLPPSLALSRCGWKEFLTVG